MGDAGQLTDFIDIKYSAILRMTEKDKTQLIQILRNESNSYRKALAAFALGHIKNANELVAILAGYDYTMVWLLTKHKGRLFKAHYIFLCVITIFLILDA